MCIYMRERPSVVSVCMYNSSNSVSFIDIKDPAKRMALVDKYVTSLGSSSAYNHVRTCNWSTLSWFSQGD